MSEIRVDTISEKTSANGVSIDGVTIKDGGIAATDGSTITTADNTDTLTLISTDADATVGPNLNFYRNSGSPADNDDLGKIVFNGRNDNSQDVVYAQIRSTIVDASDGTEDGLVKHDVSLGGTAYQHLSMGNGSIVFNEESQDIDFRVESNNNEHMFFVNGGDDRVGFKTAPDLGHVHIRIGDSGGSVNSAADCLVIEESGNAGMTILTGNTTSGSIHFGDNGDNDKGFISYSHNTDDMFFSVNGNGSAYSLVLHDGGQVSTGGETAPDGGDGGLCLDQNANDGVILSLKSSDIAHGITNDAETDTYATFGKAQGTTGGLMIKVMAEALDSERLVINTNGGGDLVTNKAANAGGAIIFGVNNRNGSGTNVTGVNTDANLLIIKNFTNTQFIFDAEGTFHSNVGTATYDEYDDAHLVRAMDLSTSTKGLIASKFDEFIQYKHEDLAAAKIVGRDEDGTPNSMVNWTAMSQLHNGAIWQQYEKHQKLASAFYKLATKTIGKAEADKLLTEEEIQLLN